MSFLSVRRGTPTLASALTLLACAAAFASPLAAQKRPMTIVDLIAVPSVRSPVVSPDGERIVYVKSEADWAENRTISHLFLVNADGTGTRQLTYGKEGQSSPLWSPDGEHIAFLARRGDQDNTQIHLLPADGGEARPLTDHETSVGSMEWSPDGAFLYFLATDPMTEEEKEKEERGDDVFAFDEEYRQRHLWKVDVETGEESRVTQGDFSIGGYALSRDGARVAHVRTPTPLLNDIDKAEIFLMDIDGGRPLQLTADTVPQSGPELSPDGRHVLFTADSNEEWDFYYNDKIFIVPADGGEARTLLPDFPGSVSGATWSADGRSILFVASVGVRRELFRADVATGELTRLTRGDHAVGSVDFDPDAGLAAFTLQSRTSPGDVWIMDMEIGSAPRQVSRVFDYLDQDFLLPRQEAIRWRGEDGVEVEGLLFYPLEYEEGTRYPLIVQTHGGPASADLFQFGGSSDYIQVLTSKGYFVLLPNYRGSTGYGDDFLRDMVGHYFNQAHLDVMAGVDHLIELGLVDGDRMGKMGWSAGGHMTNKIITFTDRFKAASSGAGASNWVSMYAQSDVRVYRTPWFGGNPWEADAPIEQYWDDSPLKYAADVTTPTLFLVGQNDARVPMPQSVEMYRALKANGIPTHLYVAPRQGHGWRELYHRLFKANVEMDWWERWVMDRKWEWEEAPEGGGG